MDWDEHLCLFYEETGLVNAETIITYFPGVNEVQRTQLTSLFDIYKEWNDQINVISRKDFANFYERHVLHSLGIAKIISFEPGQSVIDVGTGGGFPGVPLAILFPETQFTLCDSIGKKVKVVNEVSAHLGLSNVHGIHSRSEDIDGKYDAMVSRAVTRFVPFMNMTKHLLKKNNEGVYYLKGGDLNQEISELKDEFPKKLIRLNKLADYFTEAFFETKFVVEVK